jgi:hypothetical protein
MNINTANLSDLAAMVDDAGIDYRIINIEEAEDFRQRYQEKTGHTMTLIEAIMAIYGE